jgi:hypothetical protein
LAKSKTIKGEEIVENIYNVLNENEKLKRINTELIAILNSFLINEQCNNCHTHKLIAKNLLDKIQKEVKE